MNPPSTALEAGQVYNMGRYSVLVLSVLYSGLKISRINVIVHNGHEVNWICLNPAEWDMMMTFYPKWMIWPSRR